MPLIRFLPAAVFLCLCISATPSRADLMFSFSQASYSVDPNHQVSVEVSLMESGVTSSTSVLVAGGGLSAAGVRISFDDPTSMSKAMVASSSDILANPSFDDTVDTIAVTNTTGTTTSNGDSPYSAGLGEFVATATGVQPVYNAATSTYSIDLGTFIFTAGSFGGDKTTITTGDLYSGSDDTVTSDGTVLDALIKTSSAVIKVNGSSMVTVPEPATMLMLGQALLGLAWLVNRARVKARRPS